MIFDQSNTEYLKYDMNLVYLSFLLLKTTALW